MPASLFVASSDDALFRAVNNSVVELDVDICVDGDDAGVEDV